MFSAFGKVFIKKSLNVTFRLFSGEIGQINNILVYFIHHETARVKFSAAKSAFIAPVGHLLRQAVSVQFKHLLLSITATNLSIFIAPLEQFLTHKPQPKQAFLHAWRATGALACELQTTCTGAFKLCNTSKLWGQVVTHLPQPVQISLSIAGSPSAPIVIAPNGQARTQLPKPKQPYLHALGPP